MAAITLEVLHEQIKGVREVVNLIKEEQGNDIEQICIQLASMNGRQREHREDISANRESISIIQQRQTQLDSDLTRSVNMKVGIGWILSVAQAVAAFFAAKV